MKVWIWGFGLELSRFPGHLQPRLSNHRMAQINGGNSNCALGTMKGFISGMVSKSSVGTLLSANPVVLCVLDIDASWSGLQQGCGLLRTAE